MIKHLLSRLLERASDCDFLKYCLEYDEFHHHKTFHHQMHEELGGAATGSCEEIAKIASAKLSHLQGVEKDALGGRNMATVRPGSNGGVSVGNGYLAGFGGAFTLGTVLTLGLVGRRSTFTRR